MRIASLLFVAAVFWAGAGAPALGAVVSATLLADDSPRGNQWETVAVEFALPAGAGGGSVSIRDVRGGVRVSRALPEGVGGSAVRILLPLPLVAPAQLGAVGWPVEVVIGSGSGERETQRVVIALPAATEGKGFRVGVVNGGEVPALGALSKLMVVTEVFSADDFLSGPALIFSSCDAVVIPEELLGRMGDERLGELLAAGVHLFAESRVRPGALRGEGWVSAGDGGLWRYGSPEVVALRVIEPGLEKVSVLTTAAEMPVAVRWIVILVPVGALVGLLLVRGLVRSRMVLAISLAGVMAGLGIAAVLILQAMSGVEIRAVGWRTGFSDAGDFRFGEQFRAASAVFGRMAEFEAEEPTIVAPVASSVRRYFGMEGAELWLGVAEKSSLVRVSRLRVRVAHDLPTMWVERGVSDEGVATTAGSELSAGYVSTGGGSVLFSQWADAHPEFRDSLLAWYELRFAADHRYRVFVPGGVDAAREASFSLIDLGAGETAGSEAGSAAP